MLSPYSLFFHWLNAERVESLKDVKATISQDHPQETIHLYWVKPLKFLLLQLLRKQAVTVTNINVVYLLPFTFN